METEFTERRFRDALGLFPTGVAIVAAKVGEALLGATISSFNSVSLTPPLVLFSLSRKSLSADLWRRANAFSITVLREDERDLSSRFAKAGADKWRDMNPVFSDEGVPMLAGGLSTFVCRAFAVHESGDHDIFVGEVVAFSTSEGEPLLFHQGKYKLLNSSLDAPAGLDHALYGW